MQEQSKGTRGATSSALCPRCGLNMMQLRVGDKNYYFCNTCYSKEQEWMKKREAELFPWLYGRT